MNIKIPDEVIYIINILESNGYEAYAVGGCVRDSLLGKEPKDWDICTSAIPEQTIKCFEGCHIIETGLKHGTITLMLNHQPFEITTYRIDGVYSDNRRPDNVEFVRDLKEDLSRRDFTVNAMAYNPKTGIADFFDGVKDLESRIIKCVGNPNKRFQEDALRIMRAMRFASVLGFEIDGNTSKAMFDNKSLLRNIASERVAVELNKLIVGDNVKEILLKHTDIICEVIPEISLSNDTLESLINSPKDLILRLVTLFHEINSDTAKKILSRLKYDNETIKTVTELVLYYDADIIPDRKSIKRWLKKIGAERFRKLLEIKKSDKLKIILDEIIGQNQCYSLKDLAVNGIDLIDIGITEGKKIGDILNKLTDMVIDEKIENDRTILLEIAKGL